MNLLYNFWDWNIFWWEFFGTALFAHGVGCSDGADWYITVSLFAAILLIAPFTGGHVNPAVSFGFLIKNAIIPNEKTGEVSWEWMDFFCRMAA